MKTMLRLGLPAVMVFVLTAAWAQTDPKATAVRLDGGTMPSFGEALHGTSPIRVQVGGIALNIAADAASVELDGRALGGRRDCYSGFMVRDVAAGGDWLRPADLEQIGLRLTWKTEALNGAVRVQGMIEDLTGKDRAVSVAFALPVAADGLVWWQDVRTSSPVSAGREYLNARGSKAGARGLHSFYPLAAVTPAGRGGLALATGLDQPAVQRLLYDTGAERMAISFDFGLAPDCTPFPSRAPFSFLVYNSGPDFRSATARYQEIFPGSFTKRPMQEGIWMPFDDISTVEAPADFGFMFQEGAPNVAFDDRFGVYSFPYVEPMSWWMPMPKEMPRTYEAATGYVQHFFDDPNSFVRNCARDLATCGLKGPDGKYALGLQNTPWCDGAVFTYDINPAIGEDETSPINRAHLNYGDAYAQQTFGAKQQAHRPAPGPGADGMYLDSIEGWGNNTDCARDHFKVVGSPLTFDYASRQPAILQWVSTTEFVKWIGDDLHSRGRLLMANSAYWSVPWMAPYLDVAGTEVNWLGGGKYAPNGDDILNGFRWLSGQRPYLLLNNTDYHAFNHDMMSSYFRRALFYGIYPSNFSGDYWDAVSQTWKSLRYWQMPELYNRDRDLYLRFIPVIRRVASAGWQVRTGAHDNEADVWEERFGDPSTHNLYFTVFNSSQGYRDVTVVMQALKLAAGYAAVDLVSGLDLPLTVSDGHPAFGVALPGQGVAAVVVGSKQDVAASLVELAADAIGRQRVAAGADGATGAMWADSLRKVADGLRGAADAAGASHQLALALAGMGALTLLDGATDADRERLRRDISLGQSWAQRARMELAGLKLQAKLEGDPTPGADITWEVDLLNAGGTHSEPVAFTVGSQPGREPEPLTVHVTRKLRVSRGLPSAGLGGQWNTDTIGVSFQVGGALYQTFVNLDSRANESAGVSLVQPEVSARETTRSLVAHLTNPGRKPIAPTVTLSLPDGWTVEPQEASMKIEAGQSADARFTVQIPASSEPTGYEAKARVTFTDGRQVLSDPAEVFYFGHPEFEKWVNLALTAKVLTDSSYDGYGPRPLNDGVVLPAAGTRWNDAAWASTDTPTDHWVEVELPQAQTVDRVTLVWPYDNGSLLASRDLQVQAYDEARGEWTPVAQVEANPRAAYTLMAFGGVSARRWRIFQPAGGGPGQRPNIMWMTEIGVYAAR